VPVHPTPPLELENNKSKYLYKEKYHEKEFSISRKPVTRNQRPLHHLLGHRGSIRYQRRCTQRHHWNWKITNQNIYLRRNIMKKNLASLSSQLQGTRGRFIIFLVTVALFVISAGAPNATIGIGK